MKSKKSVGLLAAVNPFHVAYSQEARMYALLGLAAVTAAYGLLRALQEGRRRWWVLYAVAARLGTTLADPRTARLATSFVNARISPDDVVLCSPTIAWLLHAHAADFQMAIAATGQATQHFPADIPSSRFRFDPRLENATYVILDPLWRGWASAQMPEVAEMVREVEEEWELERRFGEFEVYRHPPGEKR